MRQMDAFRGISGDDDTRADGLVRTISRTHARNEKRLLFPNLDAGDDENG